MIKNYSLSMVYSSSQERRIDSYCLESAGRSRRSTWRWLEISEDGPIIDKLILDEYIASNPTIDGHVVCWRNCTGREFSGGGEADSSEKYRVLDARIVFTIILFTNVVTLMVNPSLLIFTLPISVAVSFLASSLSRLSEKKRGEDYGSRRIRGDEEWW